jgi:hypothetical protein
MTPDLSFLPKQERKTVSLILAGLGCVGAGFWVRGLVSPAEAAPLAAARMAQIEARVNAIDGLLSKLDRDMARVMDRLNVPQEPGLPRRP